MSIGFYPPYPTVLLNKRFSKHLAAYTICLWLGEMADRQEKNRLSVCYLLGTGLGTFIYNSFHCRDCSNFQ